MNTHMEADFTAELLFSRMPAHKKMLGRLYHPNTISVLAAWNYLIEPSSVQRLCVSANTAPAVGRWHRAARSPSARHSVERLPTSTC
jgi:hypothetical protein